MSENSEAQLSQLQEKLARLEEQVILLQTKQQKLIDYLIHSDSAASQKQSPTPPSSPQVLTATATAPATPQKERLTESLQTTQILPLIAVVCFVLAAVFLVKLGMDSGWLTVSRQWGLLCLLGFVLVGSGRFLEALDKGYRTYLSAAGIVVLYIASFSATLYFKVLAPEVSFSMAGIVSLLSLYLFEYDGSEIFSLITSIGTYLSPLLMGTQLDLLFHGAYFILWAAVFSILSVYLRSRTMVLASSYFGIGVFTLLFSNSSTSKDLITILAVLIAQFTLFSYGVYSYSVKNNSKLSQQESLSYLPALLFFYGTTYYFLNKLTPEWAPWISLLFCGFLGGLYFFAKQKLKNLESQKLIQGFFAVVLFHSGYLQILPEQSKPWLIPTLLLLHYLSDQKKSFPQVTHFLKVSFFLMGLIEFGSLVFKLVAESNLKSLPVTLATILVGIFIYFKPNHIQDSQKRIFLSLIHLLAILSLYRLLFDFGTFAVSLGWGLYSTLILIAASWRKDRELAESSLLVLVITSLKALLHDASQAPSGLRILSLLITGLVMYGAGYYLSRIKAWNKAQ